MHSHNILTFAHVHTYTTLAYIHETCMHTCTCTCHTVHIYTQDGCTALYRAAANGHDDVVELLLKAKADPDKTFMVIG